MKKYVVIVHLKELFDGTGYILGHKSFSNENDALQYAKEWLVKTYPKHFVLKNFDSVQIDKYSNGCICMQNLSAYYGMKNCSAWLNIDYTIDP